MIAEVLAVGTELLMGQVANTDAQHISKTLPSIGIGVYYHTVVGDNPTRVKDALKRALERADIVVTTGGLGPTQDDLTKETIAEQLGLRMVFHEEEAEKLREFFKKTNRIMPESNLRQAYFPEGSIILKNVTGTAPGCIIPTEKGCIVVLPGPPKELVPMFDNEAMPYLSKLTNTVLKSKYIRIIGFGESIVEEKIMGYINGQTNPTFATYVKDGVITIRVTASGDNADNLLEEATAEIHKIFGNSIFTDENIELDEILVKLLRDKGLKIATAESCTGGLIAGAITAHGGASDVFETGVVTYSESEKMRVLGVKKETLEKYTVYSKQVAVEMAEGLHKFCGADVCVSITGVAGPGGGTEETPVGTLFVGVYYKGKTVANRYNFRHNSRENIRAVAVTYALNDARKAILEND